MKQRLRELNLGDRHRRAELHFNRGMFAPARDEYVALIERASGLTDEASQLRFSWKHGPAEPAKYGTGIPVGRSAQTGQPRRKAADNPCAACPRK